MTQPALDAVSDPRDDRISPFLDRRRFLARAGLATAGGVGAALGFAEPAGAASGAVFDVRDPAYGAVGDGVADDTAAIQAAAADAAAAHGTLFSPAGFLYRISSTITVSDRCNVDFSSSQLKKANGWTSGYAVSVTGENVVVHRLRIHGNRTEGATGGGILFQAVGGVLSDSTIEFCQARGSSGAPGGVVVGGSQATLECVRVTSSDHDSGNWTGDGFLAWHGGVLRAHDCVAERNDRSGFLFDVGHGPGCHVSGHANANGHGVWIMGDDGTSDFLYVSNNRYHNVYLNAGESSPGPNGWSPTGWKFSTIVSEDQGLLHEVPNGSHVGLYSASRCQFGTIITRRGGGWGVVLARSGPGAPGASHNSFGVVMCDRTGGRDTDPGVSLQMGSKFNTFGTVTVRRHSCALAISEEYEPFDNDYNTFGQINAYECPWGAVVIGGGSHNDIGRVAARDCGNFKPLALWRGLVSFVNPTVVHPGIPDVTGTAKGNVVGFVDHKSTKPGMAAADVPIALVWAHAGESENYVLDGIARDVHADVIDDSGGNFITLRHAARAAAIDGLEVGWTGSGSTNTSVGQFVEGAGGRKVVGAPLRGGGSSTWKAVALNLSAMDPNEWFRIFAYVENVAAMHPSAPATLRFATDSRNFFDYHFSPCAFPKRPGPVHLFVKKGGFTEVGSPNWGNITQIRIWTNSTDAGGFTVTWDDLVRISSTRFSHHSGSTRPAGGAPGDVRAANGKLWVNDDGIWKSTAVS